MRDDRPARLSERGPEAAPCCVPRADVVNLCGDVEHYGLHPLFRGDHGVKRVEHTAGERALAVNAFGQVQARNQVRQVEAGRDQSRGPVAFELKHLGGVLRRQEDEGAPAWSASKIALSPGALRTSAAPARERR
jgi:hypothetical protein